MAHFYVTERKGRNLRTVASKPFETEAEAQTEAKRQADARAGIQMYGMTGAVEKPNRNLFNVWYKEYAGRNLTKSYCVAYKVELL